MPQNWVSKGVHVSIEWVQNHVLISMVIALLFLIVIGSQFFYPADRALLFSKINGSGVGIKSTQEVTTYLNKQYRNVPITIATPGKTIQSSSIEVGISPDNEEIIDNLTNYPWWQRLIPFSLPVKGMMIDTPAVVRIDATRFNDFIDTQLLKACTRPAVDAALTVEGDTIVLQKAKDGITCDKKKFLSLVLSQPLETKGVKFTAPTRPIRVERTDAEVQKTLEAARAVLEKGVSFSVAGLVQIPDKPTLASWLTFIEDPKSGQLSLDLREDKISAYLGVIQKSIYIAPGKTVIDTLDGIETARVEGSAGRGIDIPATIKTTEEALIGSSTARTVTATLAVLPAIIEFNPTYTPTPAGLQALINDLVKEKGDFAISVRRLGDEGVHANGTKQYHPASTYKMYVGWAVIKRIETGQMRWQDMAVNGQTIAQCFDVMIINSDNACAEWLGEKIGWTSLHNQLKGIGLSCTNLSTAWLSCANDEALFLQKLEAGQLLSGGSRDRLLDVMKSQAFRQGIPKGVNVPVADKVGFINGYLHDAAIVYAPGGTYILTIMSKGSSWSAIADAARQVHEQMQRIQPIVQ